MESFDNRPTHHPRPQPDNRRAGRFFAGFVVASAGAILLAKKMGVEFPDWLFSWPMLIILLGVFIGANNSFRGFGWIFLIVVGLGFLAGSWFPDVNLKQFILPVLLLLGGLYLMFGRGKSWD